nr:integrase, catalytic region, zinc finger, CCHC-type, peptidase aspartic, catalytic [Tanacetum cinerariifolium]
MNDVSLKAMQNQIDMVKNELRNEMKTSIQTSLSNQTNKIKNMMANLLQMNTASTSGSGTLPGNTITNPKGELKAITTRSGLVAEGPTVSNPPKPEKPKVLAPGMYAISSKYITPPRQGDWAPPTHRKKHVTFQEPPRVVQIVLWYLDSGCLRHMTGDRSKLINYVEKFVGTVRFGNDQFAMIVGYGDYKMGDTIISRVYCVEGLSHNLFSVG